jgi:hypothetical protein
MRQIGAPDFVMVSWEAAAAAYRRREKMTKNYHIYREKMTKNYHIYTERVTLLLLLNFWKHKYHF